MDLELIKQNYERLPDFRIVEMANYEANQLPTEVLQILINEIRVRNLSTKLLDSINVTTKELSEQELTEYVEIIRNLPDPTTGKKTQKLNATIVSKAVSYFFFSQKTNLVFIGSPESIAKKLEDATTQTALLGWWGFRSFFAAISSLRHNSKMTKINYKDKPTEILIQFVKQNVGFIESNKKDTQKLIEFLNNSAR